MRVKERSFNCTRMMMTDDYDMIYIKYMQEEEETHMKWKERRWHTCTEYVSKKRQQPIRITNADL